MAGETIHMTKPFNPRELVARVKAILHRARRLDVAEVFAFDHHFDQMAGLGLERVPAVLQTR